MPLFGYRGGGEKEKNGESSLLKAVISFLVIFFKYFDVCDAQFNLSLKNDITTRRWSYYGVKRVVERIGNKKFWKELICLLSLHYIALQCMTSLLNFIKIYQFVQKLLGGHTHTHTDRETDSWTDRQTGDLISLTFLFKDSRLKSEQKHLCRRI
jgi:hypothetical protein